MFSIKNLKDLQRLIAVIGPDAVKKAAPLIVDLAIRSTTYGEQLPPIRDEVAFRAGLVAALIGVIDALVALEA